MEFDPALRTYISESRELLEEMEAALLRLENEESGEELLNEIFRAAHTIKGSAGIFALDHIVEFTHGVETLLDRLRDGEIEVSEQRIALLLLCKDHINDLIESLDNEYPESSEMLDIRGKDLAAQIREQGGASGQSEVLTGKEIDHVATTVERLECDDTVVTDNWHISLRFAPESLRDGMDPLSFIRYLNKIGKIVNIKTLDDALPDLNELDPERCYLGFEINFKSEADKSTIEGAFEFIKQDSIVRITSPRSRIVEYIELIQELPEEDMYLGEILVRCGSLTQSELDEVLSIQKSLKENDIDQPIGDIAIEQGMTTKSLLDAAVEKQSSVREGKKSETQSVRVDAIKLDHLINLIGELVIAGAGTSISALKSGDGTLIESVSTLTRLVEEVRDSALRLRMVQIGATFNRFQRVVRDVSKELNKEINLVITGAETELDKSVVEKIGDPLMHLVRNAMDHGIESADKRSEKNKPKNGTVCLNAYHDSGSIVIEVSDDGGGLDIERIHKKAVEKGLVDPELNMDEGDIFNLIFEPGFSTAAQVSNLSGRGVGMDVVKRNIAALRGTIDVESTKEIGTTFRIRMPLTLAIIDGFLVGVDKSSFVIPLDMVFECVELDRVSSVQESGRDYINLRGEVLPLIRLRDMFEVGGCPAKRENVVVVQYAGHKAGLVVDQLMGEFQTVIKPLGRIFSHLKGVGGSTILGNGEVALILDVAGLVKQISTREFQAITSAA